MSQFASHTDSGLLALLKEGDELAFSELYRRYSKKLIASAYSKLNSREGAKEIIQETFLDLWQRRETLQIECLSSYLHVATKYKVLTYIRNKLTAERHCTYYKAFIKLVNEQTAEDVGLHELQDALEKGLQKLPEKTQVVFRLNKLEHRSIDEIASQLNVSKKAIKYHLSRSIKELRLHLREFILSVFAICCFWN